MKLSEALSVLSKSSPYAVTTRGDITDPQFEGLKRHLYVTTEIEAAFKSKLDRLQPGGILFLCGSSGDGKSEILTRYDRLYTNVEFHLDATHSFESSKTAIQTLNELFTRQQATNLPLVVGINIGMLGNFQQDGDKSHNKIRTATERFLINKQIQSGDISFLDFEAFPKFSIEDTGVESSFFSTLLDRVVRDYPGNPFRAPFELSGHDAAERKLCANYRLLRLKPVQRAIVELLFQARVRKDQFITARMLLDFIYSILTGPGYLFDNLFAGGDNELLACVADFDPSVTRNRQLDRFLVDHTLGITDPAYGDFCAVMREKLGVDADLSGCSILRLFYLVRYSRLFTENPFLCPFEEVFSDNALQGYCAAWRLHNAYDGDNDQKQKLRHFYGDVVFAAINRFANRNAPVLNKDEFFITTRGDYVMAAELELSVEYKKIQKTHVTDQSAFQLQISVGDEPLAPVLVSINLLELMQAVVNGYRPNRHDKNSIVLLEDVVHQITTMARSAKTLHLYKQGRRDEHFRLKQTADQEIRVSGL